MKKIIKYTFIAIIILLALFVISKYDEVSVEMILSYSPKNVFLAVLFILFLYALKSISIVFPVILLQMASGFLFSAPVAVIINFVGAIIEFAIPYYIGYITGADAVEKRIQKNTRFAKIIKGQKQHDFFSPFFLRVINVLPCDLVSMYFGAIKLPFFKFVAGSFLGTLPGIIPATFMGKSITDPLSPEFLISLSITIISSLLTMVIFYFYNQKRTKKDSEKK